MVMERERNIKGRRYEQQRRKGEKEEKGERE